MQPISYSRHRFPPEVIRQAVWLYLRFTLSYRDVEELLAGLGCALSIDRTEPAVRYLSAITEANVIAIPNKQPIATAVTMRSAPSERSAILRWGWLTGTFGVRQRTSDHRLPQYKRL